MKKVKLVFIVAAAVFCFACGNRTEADFSIVPVKGSNGEYQYIDVAQNGKIVINPQFERAHIFRDGLALVKTSGYEGKWGYIDKKGKFAIAPVYSKAQDFSENVAWVQLEDQPPMLIDKKGKTILQIDSLTAAYPFSKGIAGINVHSQGQGLTMFIDKKGKPVAIAVPEEKVVPLIKDGLYSFQDKETEKWGYKNKNGEIVINAQFDHILFFIDGMATILSGNKWGAVDKKGSFVINPQYDELAYDGDGLFEAKVGKKWGWVNKKGEITINPQFDLSMGFSGSKLAAVQMGDKWAYIDRKGQIIINPQFLSAFAFNGNYAMVINTERKVGFIDKEGKFIVPPLYEISENDIYEYVLATGQNIYDLPVQYFMRYMAPKVPDYQNGDFYMYERLKEKIEEGRQRAMEKKEENRQRTIAAASGSFTDSRDNKTYKTIKIGTQTWMAQNLNYVGDGYLGLCYGDKPREQIRNPENCEKYGRLYDWSEAMGLDREYNGQNFGRNDNVQGVCPAGWHLPTDAEWSTLDDAVGGSSTAGTALKSRSGWNDKGNGSDNFGFSALPGGLRSGGGVFNNAGNYAYFWSATENNASYAWDRYLHYDFENMYRSYGNKPHMFSVRCVKDDKAQQAIEPKEHEKIQASGNTLTDSRDNKTYKTVKIGSQNWMAKNLNYAIEGGKCYDNKPENCEKYGRLYDWATANKVCPSGWHLPSDAEWGKLANFAGGAATAGAKLKAKNNNGTDDYGFAALPGGNSYDKKTFEWLGVNGYWWSVSEKDDKSAYYRAMGDEIEELRRNSNFKAYYFSVRCVQD